MTQYLAYYKEGRRSSQSLVLIGLLLIDKGYINILLVY